MGARLITFDLTSGFNITEEAAEAMKIAYAAKAEVNDAEHVAAYVNSRAGEIAANVLAQLNTAGYNAQTLNKIVLTGGGSHIPAFAAQLTAQGKMPTRFAEMPRDIAFRVAGRNTPDNIDIIALLMAGVRKIEESCPTPLAPRLPGYSIRGRTETRRSRARTGRRRTRSKGRKRAGKRDGNLHTRHRRPTRSQRERPRHIRRRPRRRNTGRRAPQTHILDLRTPQKEQPRAEHHQRRNSEPIYNDPEGEDPFGASEEDPYEEYEDNNRNRTERAGDAINNLRDKFCKLFSSANAEEEENADADDY